MIDVKHLRFAADRHMKAGIIDPLIADAGDHFDAAGQQGSAMDPAGGFPQPVAGLAGFALQHHDLAWAFSQLHPFRA